MFRVKQTVESIAVAGVGALCLQQALEQFDEKLCVHRLRHHHIEAGGVRSVSPSVVGRADQRKQQNSVAPRPLTPQQSGGVQTGELVPFDVQHRHIRLEPLERENRLLRALDRLDLVGM